MPAMVASPDFSSDRILGGRPAGQFDRTDQLVRPEHLSPRDARARSIAYARLIRRFVNQQRRALRLLVGA